MKKSITWFLIIYTILRVVLLPIQHTGDGWGYACEIIKGDMFSPHHLLYKPLMHMIYKGLLFFNLNLNPIQIFSTFNILLGSFTLLTFYKTLNTIKPYTQLNFWLTFLVAFTFGFLRYSSENETYILPLFFSIMGTFFYFKGRLSLGILFLTTAVLCHQIHIFWLIAFLIPQKNKHYAILPSILSLGSIVIVYVIYAKIYNVNWYSLPFYDVQQGLVDTTPGVMNFVMTPISFIRTFFQLHGNIKDLLIDHPFNFIFIILGIVCLFVFLMNLKHIHQFNLRLFSWIRSPKMNLRNPLFIAIFLQFSFAVYSVGNAEFMVMLPFLLILWQYERIANLSLMFIHYIGMSMLIWNFTFYVIPSALYDFGGMKQKLIELNKVFQSNTESTPQNVFVTDDNIIIYNYCEYLMLTHEFTPNFKIVSEDEFEKMPKLNRLFAITDKDIKGKAYDRKSLTVKSESKPYILKEIVKYKATEFPQKEVILSRIKN
jgi:hypothetical protein